MPLGSVTTQLLFNPPYYEASGGDTLTASSGGTIVTPSVHTPASAEIGSFITIGGLFGPGNITQGTYTVQSLSGGGYVLDRSCGSDGDVSAAWNIGGNNPFPNTFGGSGVGLNVAGSHSTTEGNNFSNVSDPGCVRINAQPNATTGAPYICQAYTGSVPYALTWESLGVPSGKFVVKMEGRCRAKVVTVSGTVTDAFLRIGVVLPVAASDPFGQFVFHNVPKDIGWATYSGPTFCIDETDSPSDTALRLLLNTTGSVGNSSEVDIFVDTVEMTIYYDDQWCDYCTAMAISPHSVTLAVGQNQNFTTNLPADFSIVEGGDSGTLSNIGDQIVTYTAGNTPGTYHLLAEDQCVAGNDDTATITAVAAGEDAFLQVKFKGYNDGDSIASGDYGLPTNFLVRNPQENIVYQLSEPATDVNNFINGKTGWVELIRNGGALQDTTTDPIGFVAIELLYECS